MRVFNLITEKHDIQWTLVGGFLRRFFSGDVGDSNLDILCTNRLLPTLVVVNLQKVFKDLEVMGFMRGVRRTPTQISGTASMCAYYNEAYHELNFDVIAFTNAHHSPQCAADTLALSSTGLTAFVIKTNDDDRVNTVPGIALLDRLADLKARSTRFTGVYYDASEDVHMRKSNAQLLRKEHQLIAEGLTLTGPVLLHAQANCPVCLEQRRSAVLACKHAFCYSCLANHMSLPGENHGKCPMCRAPIQLLLHDAA